MQETKIKINFNFNVNQFLFYVVSETDGLIED